MQATNCCVVNINRKTVVAAVVGDVAVAIPDYQMAPVVLRQ